jgi:hypothetical protein
MLTTKEIKDKAERSYKDFLISVLRREIFFPFHIKGNKGNANLPLQDLFPALKHLIDNSKEKIGYGYTVTYKEVNTRHSGIMTMPDAIFFENPQDFLKFIEKEQAFLTFRKAIEVTKKQIPALLKWIEDNVLKCQKNADNWDAILKVITHFIQNPKPNCYWRQLKIDVDLMQLETYKPLIGELLDFILPPNAINKNETQFDARFNLLFDEPLIRLRFLDTDLDNNSNDLSNNSKANFNSEPPIFNSQFLIFNSNHPLSINSDFALPLSKMADFEKISHNKVFLITDKDVFLAFPKLENAIAIYWEHTIDVLIKINGLNNKTVYLLTDITFKGFEQLSEMRSVLPNLKAFMMDKTVFDAFPQHHQTQKVNNVNAFLIHLNAEEQLFYKHLLNLKELNGLLQRDVAHSFLEKQLGI